jgi:hypothetical protein
MSYTTPRGKSIRDCSRGGCKKKEREREKERMREREREREEVNGAVIDIGTNEMQFVGRVC